MHRLEPAQDVGVTLFPFRVHALAEKLLALPVQDNAFNLRAAEVNADAKHIFQIIRKGGGLFKRAKRRTVARSPFVFSDLNPFSSGNAPACKVLPPAR